jgi:hypothetical protein
LRPTGYSRFARHILKKNDREAEEVKEEVKKEARSA